MSYVNSWGILHTKVMYLMMKKFIISSICYISLVTVMYGCKNEMTIEYHYPPEKPINPVPSNGSQNITTPLSMSWTCSDPNSSQLTYDIYLDNNVNPTNIIASGNITNSFELDADLEIGLTYYWKITAKNTHGLSSTSEVWQFTASNTGTPWKLRKPMPTSRYDLSSAVLGNFVYAIGGIDNSGYTRTVEKYNPELNNWVSAAPMNHPRGAFVSVVVNNKIYVIGGVNSPGSGTIYLNSTEEYDPGSNVWIVKSNMPTPRSRMAAIVINSVIYVIGGIGRPGGLSPEALSTVEKYDVLTNTWTIVQSIPLSRAHMTYQSVNNKLYLIGGADAAGNNIDNNVFEYDPLNNAFTQKQSIPTARIYSVSGLSNGKIYAIGGAMPFYSDDVESYNYVLNSWETNQQMPTSCAKMTSSSINGKIYVFGGYAGFPLNTVFRYDPELESILN